jgi:membrane-bound serine protease (ClpP class)
MWNLARLAFVTATLGVLLASASPSAEPTAATAPSGRFTKGVIIPIEGVISDVTLESLERRIHHAIKDGADLLIFRMDTPGGLVISATNICDELKNTAEAYTVAWIRPQALSAGAMISVACDEIVVANRSKIGDCQPIMIGPGGAAAAPEDIRAKVTSPILEEFRDSARRNGYDLLLCEAMIQPEIEVFWVENTETHERRFVQRQKRDDLFGIEASEAPTIVKKTSVESEQSLSGPSGKTETIVQQKAGQYVSDEQSTTPWRYVKSDPLLGEITQPVVPHTELLTMSQDQAIAFGFAEHKLSTARELEDHYGLSEPLVEAGYTWSEKLVEWLTSPTVRAVLMMVMLLAAYTEFNTPGVGVPGIVAVACLAVFLGAPYLTGLADVWEILLIVFGVILLAIEILVIPGFGVAGIAGMVLICFGIVASFVGPEMPNQPPLHWPTLDYTVDAVKTGIWVLLIGMVGTVAGAIVLSRYLPKMPYVGTIVAPNPTAASVAMADPYPDDATHPGAVGVAQSMLRPAGKARFNETLVDVCTDGEFVESGARIEVVERHGNRIVVRRVKG